MRCNNSHTHIKRTVRRSLDILFDLKSCASLCVPPLRFFLRFFRGFAAGFSWSPSLSRFRFLLSLIVYLSCLVLCRALRSYVLAGGEAGAEEDDEDDEQEDDEEVDLLALLDDGQAKCLLAQCSGLDSFRFPVRSGLARRSMIELLCGSYLGLRRSYFPEKSAPPAARKCVGKSSLSGEAGAAGGKVFFNH